ENGHITPIISAVDHFHPETLTSHEDQPGISTSPIHTAFQSQMSGPIAGANYRDEPRILDFGAYLSLLILAGDSRLVTSPSKFKRIKKLLKHRKHRSHLFVANSPLLYPSSPPTDQSETDPNREEWISLFDRYKVSLAFDFQDDRYKRTAPLLAGQPAPEGTVYLSDGKSGSTHT